ADLEVTAVERLDAHDGLEQGRLTDTVGADDAHDSVARQREAQSIDEDTIAEALLEVLRLDDLRSETRTDGDHDLLEVENSGLLGLGRHLLVASKTCLRLG